MARGLLSATTEERRVHHARADAAPGEPCLNTLVASCYWASYLLGKIELADLILRPAGPGRFHILGVNHAPT